MDLLSVIWRAALVFLLYFFYRRSLRYLHFFQQDDYNPRRFLRWWMNRKAFDKRGSIFLFGVWMLSQLIPSSPSLIIITPTVLGLGALGLAFLESNPRKQAKKPLVVTARVMRILAAHFVFATAWLIFVFLFSQTEALWLIGTIFGVQLIPVFLVLGNFSVSPLEGLVQSYYLAQAKKKLAEIHPKVIGITGSFGKTSVKHILGHILQMQAPTLITPGSVNTLMGITRILRTQLKADHHYCVIEMGAYQRGSIAKLCHLTPPHAAIVTAIGPVHLERFGSMENVRLAKAELPQALTAEGLAIFNGDDPECQKIAENLSVKTVLYGKESGDYRYSQVVQTEMGLRFQVTHEAQTHHIEAPLMGVHQAKNIMAALACAHALGVPMLTILAALKSTPQISHRLELKKDGSGLTVLDDAYNSNPEGFQSALKTLKIFPGRKILITPGMVELGHEEGEEHARLGALAAETADRICVVRSERIPRFVEAIRQGGFPGRDLILHDSMNEALQWLKQTGLNGDTVLIENDLPDIYESEVQF